MKLNTNYLGLDLKSPIVPSASPLSESIDSIRTMEDYGAGAVVLYSLFEEQIEAESHELNHYLTSGTDSFAESLDFFPDMESYITGPDAYLELIKRATETVDIPVIASLNGVTPGGWTSHATLMEQAGAAAIELNLYAIQGNLEVSASEIEARYLSVVQLVREAVSIPVAVKLSPFFTSTAHFANELCRAGASGLVLFNRFYQPDIDIHKLDVLPRLHLSSSEDLALPLRWIAMLYGRIPADLALTSGVQNYEDAIKGLMAGASVTMMASELLKKGLFRIQEILEAMNLWLEEHEYDSIEQLQGSMSQLHVADPTAFERANYMKVLNAWRDDPTGVIL
ncbi:MAG: dihydroorotate dehydrogenase-like protein [Bacteroidetes bacterium]|nr:dihydroorotate dehydrogenase-like protein [Bacteroidota bacterium]